MFKLLTEEGKIKVEREYTIRRLVVISWTLIFILFIGLIGLLPSYVLSNARQNEARERVRITSPLSEVDESDAETWLRNINRELGALNPSLDVDRPSASITEIIERRTPGIQLTDLSWGKSKEETTISINGVAKDRQTLLSFQREI